MSYDTNRSKMWRRAAVFVDKILKGADPGSLPIEPPPKFELIINLKMAEKIGVTIPSEILLEAMKSLRMRRDKPV
jgi:putative ABC transport system substrate-binding protein